MLDGELFAFADRQGTQRPTRLDVLGIFLGHPVPEWIAVGAGGFTVDLLAHRTLLARRATRQEGITSAGCSAVGALVVHVERRLDPADEIAGVDGLGQVIEGAEGARAG